MTIEDYMRKINGKSSSGKENSYKKSIVKRTMLTVTIVLFLLIVCNLSESAKKAINKYVFETNYNFSKINSLYKKYILDFPKKSLIDGNNNVISASKNFDYTDIKDYMDGAVLSVPDNYNVKLLDSGLVVFIGEKEGYGNTVIVQQSNGIDVLYGNVQSTDIKVYDYIEKGTIIGTTNDKLYLTFTKDGEKLDYKTYIK